MSPLRWKIQYDKYQDRETGNYKYVDSGIRLLEYFDTELAQWVEVPEDSSK